MPATALGRMKDEGRRMKKASALLPPSSFLLPPSSFRRTANLLVIDKDVALMSEWLRQAFPRPPTGSRSLPPERKGCGRSVSIRRT